MAFFSVILKKNTKTPEVILNTRLDAQEVFLAYTKEVSVRHSIFLSVIEKIVTCIFCPYFFLFSSSRSWVLLTTQKNCRAVEKFP